jgi:hypothetical protein
MLIASRGELLTPAETEAVLALPVSPTNVFGETPLPSEQIQQETTLQKLFEPSRGVTPSFGSRSFTVEDSETSLYALGLRGDVATFLGKEKYEVIRKAVVKIGIAKDPQIRCHTHNTHLPPACAFRWIVMLRSRPFSGAVEAKAAEDRLKAIFKDRFDSLGGEFFLVDEDALQSEFARVSPAAFIIKAP